MTLGADYRAAAELVARGENKRQHFHVTCCSALMNKPAAMTHLEFYFKQYGRIYWFGRYEVFEPMKDEHPKNYRKRVREVRKNQQTRIYALLLMAAMADMGDIR